MTSRLHGGRDDRDRGGGCLANDSANWDEKSHEVQAIKLCTLKYINTLGSVGSYLSEELRHHAAVRLTALAVLESRIFLSKEKSFNGGLNY